MLGRRRDHALLIVTLIIASLIEFCSELIFFLLAVRDRALSWTMLGETQGNHWGFRLEAGKERDWNHGGYTGVFSASLVVFLKEFTRVIRL